VWKWWGREPGRRLKVATRRGGGQAGAKGTGLRGERMGGEGVRVSGGKARLVAVGSSGTPSFQSHQGEGKRRIEVPPFWARGKKNGEEAGQEGRAGIQQGVRVT